MRFIWSRDAGRDRDNIFDHIAPENFSAAVANDGRIASIDVQLTRFPHSGRPGRVAETRELVISGTPYIAIYVIRDGALVVLNLIHGAQQWPPRKAN